MMRRRMQRGQWVIKEDGKEFWIHDSQKKETEAEVN